MNVVYLVLEDFRGLSMKALCGESRPGRPCADTPNLDLLAQEGVLFERAYAQSPICNPSRTSAMAGRYPSATGVFDNDADGTVAQGLPNLPKLLQRAKRGRIVTSSPYSKVFHLPAGDVAYTQQPWDLRWWNASGMRHVPAAIVSKLGISQPTPKRVWRGPGYGHVDPDIFHHMAFRRTVGMLAALLNQRVPFFFAAGLSGTHTPLMPPMSYVSRHSAQSVAIPRTHPPHAPELARKDGFQTARLSTQQEKEYIATYLACVQYVDAQVGALVELIHRAEAQPTQADRPQAQHAVVIHSDHGFHLGEHGRWSKYTLYEEAVRVPLIVRVPGGVRGVRRSNLVELVDVLPTLLDLWGVPNSQRPPNLDGRSLLPLVGLSGGAKGGGSSGSGATVSSYTPRRHVRSAMRHPMRLNGEWVCGEQHYVRNEHASLTTYLHHGVVVNTTLFDLDADPLEQRNLIGEDAKAWPYATLRAWASLVAAEREAWPREGVRARDAASRSDQCGEYATPPPVARRRARQVKRMTRSARQARNRHALRG